MKERYESKVVVFLILTKTEKGKKKVLLQLRKNTGYMDDMYDMACSGHLEKGEDLTQAVVREAKEELNIDIKSSDLKLVSIVHPFHENYLNFFFITKEYKGTPELSEKDKCKELKWFDINKLPSNTIERIKNVLINIENDILYDDGYFSYQKRILK